MFPKQLISACAFLVVAGIALSNAAPQGFVEGYLKIVSPKDVELADAIPGAFIAKNYSDYPLVILSQDEKKEIARFTADVEGNYRVALPPGNYVLDVQGRAPGHVRAKPQPFRVVSDQTVGVDMEIDTGIR